MSKPTGKLIRVTPEGIGAVSSGRKVNNKPLTADITLNATDVGAYTKAESDTKIADAKKAGTDAQSTANTANTNATNANNNANGRVPNTRKINNKPLSADITLTAGDVGAYTKAETDSKINTLQKPLSMVQIYDAKGAADSIHNLSESVTGFFIGIQNVGNEDALWTGLAPIDGVKFAIDGGNGTRGAIGVFSNGGKTIRVYDMKAWRFGKLYLFK